jgi:hypothetical protein
MKISVRRAKACLLLHLVYFSGRTPNHSENIAFFALSDYIECLFFMREINVGLTELVELVDFLYKAGLVRFIQLRETIFVFLTEKACHFVQKIPDQPYLFRVEEDIDNGKKE